MTIGAGKYDYLCTYAREHSNAEGVALIVLNGDKGSGFSVQGSRQTLMVLSDLLEFLLKEIKADIAKDLDVTSRSKP